MATHSRCACVLTLSFLVVVCLLVPDTLAFSSIVVRSTAPKTTRSTTRSTTTTMILDMSILDDLNNDAEAPLFNPYQKSANKRTSASNFYSTGTTVNVRGATMNEMIAALIRVSENTVECETILQDHKDFLLEPLDDLESVLDPDSIYTPQMSRAERYQAYGKFMDERLSTATKRQVKQVLATMKEFVLRYE